MFYNCSNLTTIYAGSNWDTAGVTSSSSMFANCTSLQSVSMPDSVPHVDKTAFRGCPYSDGLSPDEPEPEAFSPMDSRAWAEFFTAPSGYSSPGEMIPQEEDPPPDTEKGLFGRIKGFFRKK